MVGCGYHFAVGQRADRLAVLADVRDQHDGGMLGAECSTGSDLCRRAKRLRKAHLSVFVEHLVAQQDHQMPVPDVEELLLACFVDRIAQVDAHNLGAERRRELPDGESAGFLMQGGGGRFHELLSRCFFEVDRARLRACFNAEVYYQIAGRSNRAVPPAVSLQCGKCGVQLSSTYDCRQSMTSYQREKVTEFVRRRRLASFLLLPDFGACPTQFLRVPGSPNS